MALLQGVVLFIAHGVVFRQLKRGFNGVDKRVRFDGLGEEFVRAAFNSTHRHRDGAVAGEKNNRDLAPAVLKGVSHLKTRDGGHLHIKHHARRELFKAVLKKRFCR